MSDTGAQQAAYAAGREDQHRDDIEAVEKVMALHDERGRSRDCRCLACEVRAALARAGDDTQFVLIYEYRSDNGPYCVGPFPSREAAFASVPTGSADFEASYRTRPITPPSVGPADDVR